MNNNKLLHGLELSLTTGCGLDCDYCPQDILMERYYSADKNRKRALSFKDFKSVLDKVEPGATIAFGGMSEPFHNRECADMLIYAYEKGYKLCLDTTLVGMDASDLEKISYITFEEFILHIPDREGHSKFVITEEYLELFKQVHKKIKIHYYSCHGTVHDAVKDIIDEKKYAGINISDRAGNLSIEGVKDTFVSGRIMCWHGSEEMHGTWIPVMFPDGSLVLCCQDYGMEHVLGNLIHQSWQEICKGEEYKRFRKGLNDDSIDLLCRKCSFARKIETLPSMRLGQMIAGRKAGDRIAGQSEKITNLVERFAFAKNICIFGLGKLWKDHFYQEYWHLGLQPDILCDNNPSVQGNCVKGVEYVKPSELSKYEDILVVVFVKDGSSIIAQLADMDIKNCITIDEINSICNCLKETDWAAGER